MNITDWKKGDRVSAAHLNDMVKAIRSGQPMLQPGVTQTPNGWLMRSGGGTNVFVEAYVAQVVEGSPDPTDSTYRVRRQFFTDASNVQKATFDDDVAPQTSVSSTPDGEVYEDVLVHNLAEAKRDTHLLLPKTYVQVYSAWTHENPSKRVNFIHETPERLRKGTVSAIDYSTGAPVLTVDVQDPNTGEAFYAGVTATVKTVQVDGRTLTGSQTQVGDTVYWWAVTKTTGFMLNPPRRTKVSTHTSAPAYTEKLNNLANLSFHEDHFTVQVDPESPDTVNSRARVSWRGFCDWSTWDTVTVDLHQIRITATDIDYRTRALTVPECWLAADWSAWTSLIGLEDCDA